MVFVSVVADLSAQEAKTPAVSIRTSFKIPPACSRRREEAGFSAIPGAVRLVTSAARAFETDSNQIEFFIIVVADERLVLCFVLGSFVGVHACLRFGTA
jgi:hypothetical protein